jgi:hypothetical protein
MEAMAVEAAAHFQVLGEILCQHLGQSVVKTGTGQNCSTSDDAAWFSVLQKNRFEALIRAFTKMFKNHPLSSRETSMKAFHDFLESECSHNQVWLDLCAFQVSCVPPSSGQSSSRTSEAGALIDNSNMGGESYTETDKPDFKSPLDERKKEQEAATSRRITIEDAPHQDCGSARQEKTGLADEVPETPTHTTSATYQSKAQPLCRSSAVPLQTVDANSEHKNSSDCFIRQETLEALAREAQEASEAESLASISPGYLKQSPWKADSPLKQSPWRAGSPLKQSPSKAESPREALFSHLAQSSPEMQAAGMQKKGFWHRMKQGFSDSSRKHGSDEAALPEHDQTRKGSSPIQEAVTLEQVSPEAAPSAPQVHSHELHTKPSNRLLKTYMKSRSKAKNLCRFLEAAGPVET